MIIRYALRATLYAMRDIGIRWFLATAKVAVLFGLLLFLLSFCSCSSARKADSVSSLSSDTASVVSARADSVGSQSSQSSFLDRILELSGIDILYRIPDTADMVSPRDLPDPPRAPMVNVHVDALRLSESSGSSSQESRDSVSASAMKAVAASGSSVSEVRTRDPAPIPWQVAVLLAFVLLVMAYTGFALWSACRPRDQPAEA